MTTRDVGAETEAAILALEELAAAAFLLAVRIRAAGGSEAALRANPGAFADGLEKLTTAIEGTTRWSREVGQVAAELAAPLRN